MPYSGTSAGSANTLIVATRSDNNNPAVFADIAARDAYTITPSGITDSERINVNNSRLAEEVFAVGTLNGSNQVTSITAAFIRLNDEWVAVATNLVGSPGDDGLDGDAASLEDVTIGHVPFKDSDNTFADSGMEVDLAARRLRTSMSIEVPPGTIYIGAETALSAAIRALNVRSGVTGNTGLLLAQLYDDTSGFQRPFAYTGEAISSVQINNPLGTATSNSARFDITTTSDELILSIAITTGTVSGNVDTTLVIRTGSHTGTVAVNNSQTVTTDAQGIAILDFRGEFNPILVDNNTQLFVTATCNGMVGVQSGADFTPNATIRRIVIERESLAFQNELDDAHRNVERRGTGLTISSSNVAEYQPNGVIEFTNESGQVDLTIADGTFTVGDELQIKHYSVGGIASAQVRIEQQGTNGRIDGETDIILNMDSAISIRLVALNVWRIVSSHDVQTTVSTEQIQDIVGAMFDHNTGVTYDDANGEIDLPADTDTGFTGVTSNLVTGNILQTTYTSPAPASPITTNVDLSVLGGDSGTVDVSGTPTENQIATWVDADTIQGVNQIPIGSVAFAAAAAVAAGDILDINTQAEYEARRNRETTTLVTSQSATVYRLPILSTRAGWYRTGDIFIYTNSASSTRSIVLQVGNAGDSFAGSGTIQGGTGVEIEPGQSVAVRLPATGRTWERVAYVSTAAGAGDASGAGGEMMGGGSPNPFLPIASWVYDENNILEHKGATKVSKSLGFATENMLDHVNASSASGPTFSATFTDEVGLVAWWQAILPNQTELQWGDDPTTAQANLDDDTGLNWITANIVTSYNFELLNRDSEHPVNTTALESANHVRIGTGQNINSIYYAVGNYVTISGASNAALNGNWQVTQVLTQHVVINVPGISDVTNTGGTMNQVWYASITPAVNISNRYVPFYLFLNPTRTNSADASVATHQFDHTSQSSQFNVSFQAPGYTQSILDVDGPIVTTELDGTQFAVSRGSKQAINVIDNVTTVNFRHYIRLQDRVTYIKTNSQIEIYLDIDASTLPEQEARLYTIVVASGASPFTGAGYYALAVGREGAIGQFDNGLGVCYVPPSGHVEVLAYNDGVNSGVRILTPIQRTREQNLAYQTDTTLTQAIADRLPLNNANRNQANDEDPQGFLIRLGGANGVPANTVRAMASGEFIFNYELTLKFNGAEGTGLLFVPVTLTPYVGSTALNQHRVTGTLLFSRNGQTGATAPKYELSMKSNYRYHATANDDFHWRLEFGTFPAGYSISDIQIFNAGSDATAQLNLR